MCRTSAFVTPSQTHEAGTVSAKSITKINTRSYFLGTVTKFQDAWSNGLESASEKWLGEAEPAPQRIWLKS